MRVDEHAKPPPREAEEEVLQLHDEPDRRGSIARVAEGEGDARAAGGGGGEELGAGGVQQTTSIEGDEVRGLDRVGLHDEVGEAEVDVDACLGEELTSNGSGGHDFDEAALLDAAAHEPATSAPTPPPISSAVLPPRAARKSRSSAVVRPSSPFAGSGAATAARKRLPKSLVAAVRRAAAHRVAGSVGRRLAAARDHRHDRHAVLVHHRALDPDRAPVGIALGGLVSSTVSRPAGVSLGRTGASHRSFLDAGRRHAGGPVEHRVDVEPHPHRAGVPAAS